ncbi:hypothetical protein E3C22_16775 [Jiella endophytica]|uniref:Uncharacterized protein n=1 Tax=Jiella endophytica TaxID=2558362 RepID=A0A4Y8RGH2_9HYPH|nr:hypothetical protein [Jiella endophytica]TFF20560.1 hypothetical protein E3C22_16775 [Jiella endophytica]
MQLKVAVKRVRLAASLRKVIEEALLKRGKPGRDRNAGRLPATSRLAKAPEIDAIFKAPFEDGGGSQGSGTAQTVR